MHHAPRLQELMQLLPHTLLQDQLRIGWRLADWLRAHPRSPAPPPALESWLAEARASIARRRDRQARLPVVEYPPELPITARRAEIVEAIRTHQVLVIAGETGSGKSTQLPKMCLEAGLGVRARIGCTQPRRLAALSVSRRLAEELRLDYGREVGCKIRFSDQTGPETYVKFMTDGMLLAEVQGDPLLCEYEVILLDEAHERSLNIDFLLGCLKQLLAKRSDLKLIITSATIDTQAFSRAFNDAPILEVSGRLYPVEVVYAPFDEASEEAGEFTYVDAAVNAIENILIESNYGDVLVFMPGERDILETRDALQSRGLGDTEIIPLFGRLSAAEQQHIFAPSSHRKIVIATNIAETSLTVPGIRYVVDSGLARMSRYNPRTRTKRLPIEPVSQSSANQRKGRCGRVAEGICVRLYSEEDFLARPLYTQPEIQRANLAEVILRLKAFKLGDIETFPFLNPPTPAAIHGGYQLLHELGALDEARALTELGHKLARLPVDPTIGRMILQAQIEGAVEEVLVIAAGLSIQDPRERPLEKQAEAATAHRRFHHPKSDFLTLLNIWNAFHDTLESLRTQNLVRRFCKAHFLSYIRMREWRDIHAQLEDALAELGGDAGPHAPAEYPAIHRAILTGLWSHVALRQEKNMFQLGGARTAMIFPGSSLFERAVEKPRGPQSKGTEPKPPPKSAQPKWIVGGEIVETSRLFARTVAEIDPEWIVELATHLIRRVFLHPHWAPAAGAVLAQEKVTLNGLVVLDRLVPFGKVDPAQATEIFIRSALVEAGLADHFQRRRPTPALTLPGRSGRSGPHPARGGGRDPKSEIEQGLIEATAPTDEPRDLSVLPGLYQFLAHNQQLRQKVELWQTRLPHRLVSDLDEAVFAAYTQRLQNVSSIPELNRFLHERHATQPRCLHLSDADLLGEHAARFSANIFPDTLPVGSQEVRLSYAYAPGEDRDGVTVRLPFSLAQVIEPGALDWTVPGLREPQILHLLQALPKTLRRPLMPLAPKAKEMAEAIEPTGDQFLPALVQFVSQRYGVAIPLVEWKADMLPLHLRPRFEILGQDAKPVAKGRDLRVLREQLKRHDTTTDTAAWQQAAQRWERFALREWNFGDLPEHVVVTEVAGFPVLGFPALQLEEGEVCLRLFRKAEDALRAHGLGVRRLLEYALQRELAWLEKDLRSLAQWRDLYVTLGRTEELVVAAASPARTLAAAWTPSIFAAKPAPVKKLVVPSPDELEATAFENLRNHLLGERVTWPQTAAAFNALVEEIRNQVPGLAARQSDLIGEILKQRQLVAVCRKPYPQMQEDLRRLLPAQFLRHVPFGRLVHLPRYLKALLIRAERAAVNPAKDQEKLQRLLPYQEALAKLSVPGASPQAAVKLLEFRWLLEEFRVSLFAQELGTAEPVSPKRLDAALAEAKALSG